MSPFKSKSQQRWMYANDPEMAKEWSSETKDFSSLPEKAEKKKKKREKQAMGPVTLAIQKIMSSDS